MPTLKKAVPHRIKQLEDCCAIKSIGGFTNQHWVSSINSKTIFPSTSGLYVAGFTAEAKSKTMYHELCKIMDIEYQSPLLPGLYGPNKIFFCVFKDKNVH